MSPAEAIRGAEDFPSTGKSGRFGFTVARAEMVGPRLFLNSMADYRDPANLSIAIELSALSGLRARYGNDLVSAFLNRPVVVDGVARRQAIGVTDGHRRRVRGLYYQTHIMVRRAQQLSIRP